MVAPIAQASLTLWVKYMEGTGLVTPPFPPLSPLIGWPSKSVPLPLNSVLKLITLRSSWAQSASPRSPIAAALLASTEQSPGAEAPPA